MDINEIVIHPSPKLCEPSPLLDKYRATLAKLDQKALRVREAYIDGIDTKEEYRENKKMLTEERAKLEQLIETEEKKALFTAETPTAEELVSRIRDILAVLNDPSCSVMEKHRALGTVLDYMEYSGETDTFRFYYLFT